MSIKPIPITPEQIAEQVMALQQQQTQLDQQHNTLQHRLKAIESSLAENDHLRNQIKALTEESLVHFKEEWKRKSEYFPDIRLQILQKTLELAAGDAAAPAAKP